ncbi:FKBP-type peptidyl-prolyl cis-trans isomerase [Candidatus Saccharibacteria bacterium]|nr:FKBP-type peptidyl-prolyl cis-trans isomerase [Candidatus Saccharibacteria bacterium]
MDEKELKTSPKQRFFIILIAVIMLGSIIASYAAIVINGSKTSDTSETGAEADPELIAEYESAYNAKQAEFKEATKDSFDKFIKYKSEIKAYNETSANENGVQTRDLKTGSGKTLTSDDSDYLAYYVGWCADESVFDSSFDDNNNPTAFSKVLDASLGMIEGWNIGVEGMKLGGIREITVPGELAYGDSMEICGGYNKPLKFMVMAVENKDPLKTLASELDTAYMRLQYAYYGIDYDEVLKNSE